MYLLKFIGARLSLYAELMRLEKPVGVGLLLWPTLCALWIAAQGFPSLKILLIFVAGTVLMRSAGCAINDYADRNFDAYVARTRFRPLALGRVQPWEALVVAAFLALLALLLVLELNVLTRWLAVPAVLIAASYPFVKRFFALPQAYLGLAFSWGIPMAFAAIRGQIPGYAWLLLLANGFWVMAYDTEYALADRDDDLKIGIRTSAITFGRYVVAAIVMSYVLAFLTLGSTAYVAGYHWPFFVALSLAGLCVIYHYFLITEQNHEKKPSACLKAFKHNVWLGLLVFVGVFAEYALYPVAK